MQEMSQNQPKVTIGIISFKDQKYLEHGIPSLLNQDYKNIGIIICDNTPNKETTPWLKQTFPQIQVIDAGGNVGFGNAHNKMIQMAIDSSSQYYLAFNSDMFASKNYVSELIKSFQSFEQKNPNKKLACLTPKLLQWSNFPENPTKINQQTYDTTGILANPSHHFKERGFGVEDKGQFDNQPQIWGSSGASPIFKLKYLQDIQHSKGEFFDKNFFMYKEDLDLSYRLRWAGYEIQYTPNSIAWHDRTGSDPGGIVKQIKARKTRGNYIKENSFLNHLQFVYKNWDPKFSLKTKLKTTIYITKYVIYLLLFDPKILKQYSKFKKLKPELLQKRKTMPRKISTKQMEKLLSNNFAN